MQLKETKGERVVLQAGPNTPGGFFECDVIDVSEDGTTIKIQSESTSKDKEGNEVKLSPKWIDCRSYRLVKVI